MIRKTIQLALYAYRNAFSLLWLGGCKFYPTCSRYASDAVEKHGSGRGLLLTFRRLFRCHPFGPGGYDPVP